VKQSLKRALGTFGRVGALKQAMEMMKAQVDAVQFECELVRVGVFVEVAGFDCHGGRSHRDVEPTPLQFTEFLPQDARLVIELRGCRHEDTTPR